MVPFLVPFELVRNDLEHLYAAIRIGEMIMKTFIVMLVSGMCLLSPYSAQCRCIASLSTENEKDLIRAVEWSDQQQIEFQYRGYLSDPKVKLDIIEIGVETCAAASAEGKTSYNIRVYYVDPTAEGSGERLLQVALCGATLAQAFKAADIGTITAIPVFPSREEIREKKARAMVLINCCPYEGKGLFSRIADGRLKRDDVLEMSSWVGKWSWRRLDPNYVLTMRFN